MRYTDEQLSKLRAADDAQRAIAAAARRRERDTQRYWVKPTNGRSGYWRAYAGAPSPMLKPASRAQRRKAGIVVD